MTKTPRWLLSVSASMALLSGFACQGGGTNGGKGSGGAAGALAADDGGVGGARKAGSSGTAGAKAGSGGSVSSDTCYVDFPCRHAYRCVGSDRYQAQETIGCQDVCPPGPCSGAICRDSGSPEACPAGTRCVETEGFDYVNMGCKAIPDAGAEDSPLKDSADAPASDVSRGDTQEADRGVKLPLDALAADTGPRQPVDTGVSDVGPVCVAGQRRCNGTTVAQTCAPSGQYWDSKACDYACRDNACAGECDPGVRRRCRATGNVPQACDSTSSWVDEPACAGSTPTCATGQCVAACLTEGQDCSALNTACCAGTECIAANNSYDVRPGSGTFVCKAIPACAALGATCSANTDCCAGLDCTAGTCAAKQTACMDKPDDGECNPSGNTCCPGTECTHRYSFEPLGCTVPTTTKPKEIACPREQPAFHEACHAAKLGLECVYTPGATQPGLFFRCLCSYHGWSCTKDHYVH
jgi:hypothetical protein